MANRVGNLSSILDDILAELLADNKDLLIHRTTPGLYKKMLRGTAVLPTATPEPTPSDYFIYLPVGLQQAATAHSHLLSFETREK